MSSNKEKILRTNNLLLIQSGLRHSEVLYKKMYSNIAFMREFRLSNVAVTQKNILDHLLQLNDIPFKDRTYQEFMIVHPVYGEIGIVALANISLGHKRAELLVGLFNSEYRVASYAVEATLAVMNYFYNELRLNRLESLIYSYNLKARKLTESLGFLHEGVKVSYIFSSKDNHYIDLYSYAMMESDFRKNKKLGDLSKKFLKRDMTIIKNQ